MSAPGAGHTAWASLVSPPRHRLLSDPRAFKIVGYKFRVEAVRQEAVRLGPRELSELNVVAFGARRRMEIEKERHARSQKLLDIARKVVPIREAALIASMGSPDATVQAWTGIIGVEGTLTGDGRLIGFGALTWAAFPLPLRWVASDIGGHEGAVIVGRIDGIQRGGDGMIRARGVLDLGSQEGREAARLVGAGFLSGISMDLDASEGKTISPLPAGSSATTVKPVHVTSEARVRAATLVAIPAFDEARIELLGEPTDPDDCGCDELSTAGIATFSLNRTPSATFTSTTASRRRP